MNVSASVYDRTYHRLPWATFRQFKDDLGRCIAPPFPEEWNKNDWCGSIIRVHFFAFSRFYVHDIIILVGCLEGIYTDLAAEVAYLYTIRCRLHLRCGKDPANTHLCPCHVRCSTFATSSSTVCRDGRHWMAEDGTHAEALADPIESQAAHSISMSSSSPSARSLDPSAQLPAATASVRVSLGFLQSAAPQAIPQSLARRI